MGETLDYLEENGVDEEHEDMDDWDEEKKEVDEDEN